MKSYLITDKSFYKSGSISEFKETLESILNSYRVDYICFRDKESQNIEELIKVFLEVAHKFKIENILINSYINLAIKYQTGIHLTSQQFDKIDYCKKNNLFTICSTHSVEEIKKCSRADAITYSPIFSTPNKGEPKGVEHLKDILSKTDKKIFALGGVISQKQIELLKESSVYGFASIRYFLT